MHRFLNLLSLQTWFTVLAGGGGRWLPLRVLGQPHHSLVACLSSSGHSPCVPCCPGEAAARREHCSLETWPEAAPGRVGPRLAWAELWHWAWPGMCPTPACTLLSPPRWCPGHWPEGPACVGGALPVPLWGACIYGRSVPGGGCLGVSVHPQRSPRRPSAPGAWASVPGMQIALHSCRGRRPGPVTWKLPWSAGWGSAGWADLPGRRAGGRALVLGSGQRGCLEGTGSCLKSPGGLLFWPWWSLEMRYALPAMFSPGLSFWVRTFRARERCVPSPLGSQPPFSLPRTRRTR